MFNFLFHLADQLRRRWVYGFISLTVAFGLVIGTPSPSQASLFDLIFRGIQIIQLSSISDRQEVALGGRINQQLVSREFRLYRDPSINSYVNQVGQRLASASSRSSIPYVFQVVDDRSVNAFATMGGYVYVTTGLMRAAENEAQLASVLGHEVGHIASRHAIQQMRQTAIARGIATAAGLDQSTAVNIGVDLALRRPNSRQDEFEADTKGLETMIAANYAPSASIAFMEKLLGQRSVPNFLSTHPAVPDRISALRRQIDNSSAAANANEGLDNAAYRNRISRLL